MNGLSSSAVAEHGPVASHWPVASLLTTVNDALDRWQDGAVGTTGRPVGWPAGLIAEAGRIADLTTGNAEVDALLRHILGGDLLGLARHVTAGDWAALAGRAAALEADHDARAVAARVAVFAAAVYPELKALASAIWALLDLLPRKFVLAGGIDDFPRQAVPAVVHAAGKVAATLDVLCGLADDLNTTLRS